MKEEIIRIIKEIDNIKVLNILYEFVLKLK